MTAGQLFLESLHSGVITPDEIDWLIDQQDRFSRAEQAAMLRLGRLLDQGQIQVGSRCCPTALHHHQRLNDWIEPLGCRRPSTSHHP